jgi:cyclic-di-GMP phosphodiesterase TipF (flagellum assembly factor)
MFEEGDFADPPDFLPRQGHGDIVRRIESVALEESIVIARRARTSGQPVRLFMPLGEATLADAVTVEALLATLDANRAISSALAFAISQRDFKVLTPGEKLHLASMNRLGIGFSLTQASSLRFDFGELQGLGFNSVRVDATRFIHDPGQFTDFHASDVSAYARRYHIDLVATGVADEQQLLTLFEAGVSFVQGPHLARPGPVRPDLAVGGERQAPALRRAEG